MYGKNSEGLKSYKTILSPITGPNHETKNYLHYNANNVTFNGGISD